MEIEITRNSESTLAFDENQKLVVGESTDLVIGQRQLAFVDDGMGIVWNYNLDAAELLSIADWLHGLAREAIAESLAA